MEIDTDEVNFLRENDVQYLFVIYNHFTDARGYTNGVLEDKQAISYAEDLDIPKALLCSAIQNQTTR